MENWNQKELERLQSLLKGCNPESEKYGQIFGRIKELKEEMRKDEKLKLQADKQDFDIQRQKMETEYKIESQKIEAEWKRKFEEQQFAHEAQLKDKELDHRIELENNDFDLKSVESERNFKIKAEEVKAKGIDFKFKLLSDIAAIAAGTMAKEYLIARLYLFESEGHVLPTRFMQFLNGLSK